MGWTLFEKATWIEQWMSRIRGEKTASDICEHPTGMSSQNQFQMQRCLCHRESWVKLCNTTSHGYKLDSDDEALWLTAAGCNAHIPNGTARVSQD